jgi:hypothetical protein
LNLKISIHGTPRAVRGWLFIKGGTAMEGSLNNWKRRPGVIRLGVGLLGLTLLVSLAYSQLAYDTYAEASMRSRQLQTRLDNFLTVRGKVNSVVEALSGNIPFANRSLAIDQRVWNLQMAWSDFHDESQQPWSGSRFLTPSPSALDAAIDQFALAALRNAQTEVSTARLDSQLTAMEYQITGAIKTAEARRDSAMAGIGFSRSVAYGAFFALSSLLVTGLLVSGLRGFKEWFGRGPVATIDPDKLASPQR